MTDEEIRALVAALPDAEGVLRTPRGHIVKSRPDAASAAALDADLHTLDAWVVAQGGQLRTVRGAASGGMGPGRRVAPLPAAPRRVYVISAAALGDVGT